MPTRQTLHADYVDLIQRIAERPDADQISAPRDITLTLEDLAATLMQHPTAFAESMCQGDPVLAELCIDRLGDATKPDSERYAHIGLCVVGFVRAYVRALVLKDVRALIERRREADSIEGGNNHADALTWDQQLAGELGLGRTMS